MTLFKSGDFVLHSGAKSLWKIDCDDLTDEDIKTLAFMGSQILPAFGDVLPVPRGGIYLAEAMWQYRTTGPLLIVDDVYTTGKSIQSAAKNTDDIALVIFTRCPVPAWVYPIFWTSPPLMKETK